MKSASTQMLNQDLILLAFLSFTLALAWKDNAITHTSQTTAKGSNLWNLEQLFISD